MEGTGVGINLGISDGEVLDSTLGAIERGTLGGDEGNGRVYYIDTLRVL